jgi:hypothetical protein
MALLLSHSPRLQINGHNTKSSISLLIAETEIDKTTKSNINQSYISQMSQTMTKETDEPITFSINQSLSKAQASRAYLKSANQLIQGL